MVLSSSLDKGKIVAGVIVVIMFAMLELRPRTHHLQVRNSSICYYSLSDELHGRASNAATRFGHSVTLDTVNVATYTGNMSRGSIKNIRRAVDIMLQITPMQRIYNPIIQCEVNFRLSFITLTVSDNTRFISASECYKTCLKPFLDWLRRTQKCNTYIWKAERQKAVDTHGCKKESRGQIHYHITTNVFILHDVLRKKWNSLQKEAGYLIDFAKRFGNYNPNSTDVHAVYKVNDLEAYLTKYISKEPEKLEDESQEDFKARVTVDGKVWDCSNNLRGTKFFTCEMSDEIHELLTIGKDMNSIKRLDIEHVDYYSVNVGKPTDYLPASEWLDYCFYKRNLNYGKEGEEVEGNAVIDVDA